MITPLQQVAQLGPRLPRKATTHNSTERFHPTYNTRRKKRAYVLIRLNPVRRSGRIGESSVRHYPAGEANNAVILASALQRKPYRNRAVGTHHTITERERYGFERSRPTNRRPPAATEVGGVRVARGKPKRASKALTETSWLASRQIRDTIERREQTCTENN